MKSITVLLVLLGVSFLTGCSMFGDKKAASASADARSNTPPAPPPVIQPITAQPVVSDSSPVANNNTSVASAVPTSTITGNSYTVQKGDTLFKIARARYGDASAVRKIKDANPGLDYDHIKAGQKINLP